MTLFESKLCELLRLCERTLRPVRFESQKWQLEGPAGMGTVTYVNIPRSVSVALAIAREDLRSTEEYQQAEVAFLGDAVLSGASSSGGAWTQFNSVVDYVLRNSATLQGNRIVVDYPRAVEVVEGYRDLLRQDLLDFVASTRLFGAKMSQKTFALSDGVTMHRLTRDEVNERMPPNEPFGMVGGLDILRFGESRCELRVSLPVTVNRKNQGSHFEAFNTARRLAQEVFESTLSAILMVKTGNLLLGDIIVSGGVPGLGGGQGLRTEPLPVSNLTIRTADIPKIKSAHKIVTERTGGDKTLERSARRFVLGCKRRIISDRLVDYVVAWESLLLTSGGNSIEQELSYRFALNGASLVSRIQKNKAPQDLLAKFKASYVVRSKIVHGGSEEKIEQAASGGEFTSLMELSKFLETNYRIAIAWIAEQPKKSRPYVKAGGWEELIWGQ